MNSSFFFKEEKLEEQNWIFPEDKLFGDATRENQTLQVSPVCFTDYCK